MEVDKQDLEPGVQTQATSKTAWTPPKMRSLRGQDAQGSTGVGGDGAEHS